MSYDVRVDFAEWPDDAVGVWLDELARMGIHAEFHPEFDPLTDTGRCPVALRIEEDSEVPVSAALRRAGTFETAFEYYATETSATFVSKRSDGTAAAFLCASALAAVTEGELRDPQTDERHSSNDGLEVLAAFFPRGTKLESPKDPQPFEGWEEDDDA